MVVKLTNRKLVEATHDAERFAAFVGRSEESVRCNRQPFVLAKAQRSDEQFTIGRIPKLDCRVSAAGDKPAPVRREGNGSDPMAVADKGPQQAACACIPNLHGLVVAA